MIPWVVLAVFVIVVALLLVAYFKGKKDEQSKTLAHTVDTLIKTEKKQEEREVEHAKRVYTILSDDITADDAGRMLSRYADRQETSSKTKT